MERLKRLIVTEAKAAPNFRPIHVFLNHLINNTNNNKKIVHDDVDDNALIDFLTFRSNTTTDHHHHQLDSSIAKLNLSDLQNQNQNQNNSNMNKKKNRIVFCDNSIFQNRSLQMLDRYAAHPNTPVCSFVIPFSTLLLCRFQMAQSDDTVSSAFKVSAYSQLRQLSAFTATTTSTAAAANTSTPFSNSIKRLCVLPPSAEIELLSSSSPSKDNNNNMMLKWNPPEILLSQHCISQKGESMFYSYYLPLLLMNTQRKLANNTNNNNKNNNNLIACCGSAHRSVQAQCLKFGMLCDSLEESSLVVENTIKSNRNNNNGSSWETSSSSSSSSSNINHRKAADLCRKYVQKLKNIDEVNNNQR